MPSPVPTQISEQWVSEGWTLFPRQYGVMEVGTISSLAVFPNDAAAMRYVVDKALQGSKIHALALWFAGRSKDFCDLASYWAIPMALRKSLKVEMLMACTDHTWGTVSIEVPADVIYDANGELSPQAITNYVESTHVGGPREIAMWAFYNFDKDQLRKVEEEGDDDE